MAKTVKTHPHLSNKANLTSILREEQALVRILYFFRAISDVTGDHPPQISIMAVSATFIVGLFCISLSGCFLTFQSGCNATLGKVVGG